MSSRCSAAKSSAFSTCCVVASGFASSISAMTPEMCGVAMEVPDISVYWLFCVQPVCIEMAHAAVMSVPGAAISGFSSSMWSVSPSSARGP